MGVAPQKSGTRPCRHRLAAGLPTLLLPSTCEGEGAGLSKLDGLEDDALLQPPLVQRAPIGFGDQQALQVDLGGEQRKT